MEYEGECYSTCPDGTFQNGQACENCIDPNCAYCTAANRCTICSGAYFLFDNSFTEESCINSCNAPHYIPTMRLALELPPGSELTSGDSDLKQCANCKLENCLQCEDLDIIQQGCTNCEPGYYLTAGSTCSSCDNTCLTCSGPSTNQCTTCEASKALHQNQCVTSCPVGFSENTGLNTCI